MPEKLPNPNKAEEDKKEADRNSQSYMKYSGMAVQMGLIILVGAYIGVKLDEKFQTKSLFTALLALLAVFAALYLTLKDFISKK